MTEEKKLKVKQPDLNKKPKLQAKPNGKNGKDPGQEVSVHPRVIGISTPKVTRDNGLVGTAAYSDQAQLRMINLTFDPLADSLFKNAGIDPDEARLLSLTRINTSLEAMRWAQQIAREAAFNIYVNHIQCEWSIAKIRRIAFLLARRSLPTVMGGGFIAAVNVAQQQNIAKSEEAAEEDGW